MAPYDPKRTLREIERGVGFLEDYGKPYDPYDFDEDRYMVEPLERSRGQDEPETLQPGRYPARVTSVIDNEVNVFWYFEILTGAFAGEELEAKTEYAFSAGSETAEWSGDILGRFLEEDERIDFDQLVGEGCEIELKARLDMPYVSGVYRASGIDPELEELVLMNHDPLDFEAIRRQCEKDRRLFAEVNALLGKKIVPTQEVGSSDD